jgi:hypothetical protein
MTPALLPPDRITVRMRERAYARLTLRSIATKDEYTMAQPPMMILTPTFSPFTWSMLENRVMPAFTGWLILDLHTDATILESDDPEEIKAKLLEFSAASPVAECFLLWTPMVPSTDEDWNAVKEALTFIGDDDKDNLPMDKLMTSPITIQRLAEALTETIHDDIPGYDDPEDFREDDFDNHHYTPLRDTLSELLA